MAEGASGVLSEGGGRRHGVRAQPWWSWVRRVGAGTTNANVGRWGPEKLGNARWVGWIANYVSHSFLVSIDTKPCEARDSDAFGVFQ